MVKEHKEFSVCGIMKAGDRSTTLLILGVLAVQNIAAGILVEVSKKSAVHSSYFPSTVVFMGEVSKLLASLAILIAGGESPAGIWKTLSNIPLRSSLKLSVPALLYTMQNNLIFVSLQNIPSATFQVFSQLKVMTTALFSVTLLGRELARVQWLALVVLAIGVTLAHRPNNCDDGTIQDRRQGAVEEEMTRSPTIGIAAVLLLTLSSGFAGVWQERIVKKDMAYPLAYVNVQMAAYSIVTNAFSVWGQDRQKIEIDGFFFGYTYLTWLIIFTQSMGGLLVSLVIKYVSNLAKSYVVSVAIFATGIISWLFLDFEVNLEFWLGAILVTVSVLLYNEPMRAALVAKQKKESTEQSNKV